MKPVIYILLFGHPSLLLVVVCLGISSISISQAVPDSTRQIPSPSADYNIRVGDSSFLKDSDPALFFLGISKSVTPDNKPAALPVAQKKPWLAVTDGYLNYSYLYRSGLDTPYTDKSLSEHFVNANIHITVAGTYPVTIFYFERETNSDFFRSYRDVKVDFDFQKFRQMRQMRQLEALKKYAASHVDPSAKHTLKLVEERKNLYTAWFNRAAVISEFIRSKELLARREFTDRSEPVKDSLLKAAQDFVNLYSKIQQAGQQYQKLYDSLLQKINASEAEVNKIETLIKRGNIEPGELKQLSDRYGQYNEHIEKLTGAYNGFQKVSIGRSVPNFSSLSLQNVNVNGINSEYEKGNLYLAIAAGGVTYQLRDFLYKKRDLPKQYVIAGRIGYGKKNGNHIILTYYTGKKQLYGGNLQQPSSYVQGISMEGQYLVTKHTKITGEIAQSGFPNSYPNTFASKSTFHFNDQAQRAYSLGITSYVPATKTQLEGYFQHSGLNFQSFTMYPYHSVVNKWYGGLQQSFWRRQVTISAKVRKNDFTNPDVLQRYDANTVYKTLTVSFRRPRWPSISIGYLPASQYTAVDSVVYENHYQTFTGTANYQYRMGLVKAVTSVICSRFLNNRNDSSFLYYNSGNFYLNQMFIFEGFSAAINLSASENRGYLFQTAESSLSALFFKKITIGGSVKVNNLNNETVKIGFNTRTTFKINKTGNLSLYADRSYLPATNKALYKYETYNISFTRYLK